MANEIDRLLILLFGIATAALVWELINLPGL
jgi:hypothetical protein